MKDFLRFVERNRDLVLAITFIVCFTLAFIFGG